MQNINIRKAAKPDIELLIKLRLAYLSEDDVVLTADEENKTVELLRGYYLKHIGSDDFIAVIAEVDGKTAAAAFLIIYERPVNPKYNPTGKMGLLLNVLTYPEFRRRGIATKLLEVLIDEAKKADLSFIELSATELGRGVYEKLGFKEKTQGNYTNMKLNL